MMIVMMRMIFLLIIMTMMSGVITLLAMVMGSGHRNDNDGDDDGCTGADDNYILPYYIIKKSFTLTRVIPPFYYKHVKHIVFF